MITSFFSFSRPFLLKFPTFLILLLHFVGDQDFITLHYTTLHYTHVKFVFTLFFYIRLISFFSPDGFFDAGMLRQALNANRGADAGEPVERDVIRRNIGRRLRLSEY